MRFQQLLGVFRVLGSVLGSAYAPLITIKQFLQKPRFFQLGTSIGKSPSNLRLARLGQLINEITDLARLHLRNRHKLPAASPAALLTGNFASFFFDGYDPGVYDRIC